MAISLKEAKPLIYRCLEVGIVPYMCSHAGLGKSDLARQIATESNAEFIDVRLAQVDPIDLSGFGVVQDGKATYVPFDTFPTEDTILPEGKDSWILMLDELSSCPRSIQTAAFKLILDRMVGQKKLHPKVKIIAAGNLATSNAHVNSMSTALQSRMAHFEITCNVQDWLDWGMSNGIDSRLLSFIDYRKELLHKFDPKHNDYTFSCPRTVAMLSKVIKGRKIEPEDTPLIDGIVGKGFSTEFRTFVNYFQHIPKLGDILADPLNTPIPDGAGMCFAATAMLAESMTLDNASTLMKYISRLNVEFQVRSVTMAFKRDIDLTDNSDVEAWIESTGGKYG